MTKKRIAPATKAAADPRSARKEPAASAAPPAAKTDPATSEPSADLAVIRNSAFAGVAPRPTKKDKRNVALAEMVSVTVPRAVIFTQDDHSVINYPVGVYDMPRAHAEDTFVAGMGVTINE